MNRLVLLALVALGSLSCDGGGRKLFADARWQVRCPPGFPMCSRAGDPVDIFNFDGDEGAQISCAANPAGDSLIINFRVARGTDPSLAVDGLVTGPDGGGVRGGACTVTVVDDGNTYQGACGPNPPSEAQPCQISSVVFDEEPETGDPRITTEIFCDHIASPSNPMLLQRNLTFPMSATEPATVAILNCDGI